MINSVALLTAPGQFEFHEEPVSGPERDEVLLEILASGLCSSELPFFTGRAQPDERMFVKYARFPLELGHEICGRVLACGPEAGRFAVGDLVTGFTVRGPGFARYYRESQANLVPVPRGVAPEHALGEPLACAVNILRNVEPELGDSAVVIGDGFMGLLLVQLLSRFPLSSLTLIGMDDDKLTLGKALAPACTTLRADDRDALGRFQRDTLGGTGADIVIELAGNESALDMAGWLIRSGRGKLCLPSYYPPDTRLTLGGYLMRKGPRLTAPHPALSPCIHDDLRRAMLALAAGHVRLDRLVTHTFPLSGLTAAFEYASGKPHGYIKGVVVPG